MRQLSIGNVHHFEERGTKINWAVYVNEGLMQDITTGADIHIYVVFYMFKNMTDTKLMDQMMYDEFLKWLWEDNNYKGWWTLDDQLQEDESGQSEL